MSTLGPATMAAALTASAHLIESLRLERDVAQAEAAELREQPKVTLAMVSEVGKAPACNVYIDDVCVFSGVGWGVLIGMPYSEVES